MTGSAYQAPASDGVDRAQGFRLAPQRSRVGPACLVVVGLFIACSRSVETPPGPAPQQPPASSQAGAGNRVIHRANELQRVATRAALLQATLDLPSIQRYLVPSLYAQDLLRIVKNELLQDQPQLVKFDGPVEYAAPLVRDRAVIRAGRRNVPFGR